MWIGASDRAGAPGTPENVFAGRIDEVAIYNSILSQSSVRTHYRTGHNRYVKLLPRFSVVAASASSLVDVGGGTSPFSYSVVSGSGSIDGTGLFTAPSTMGATTIRVTDANGNTDDATIRAYQEPDDIAGLTVWLKADALGLASGANVTTWTDSSSNGNDAAGTVAPTFNEVVLNGYPGVNYNGSQYSDLSSFTLDPSVSSYTVLTVFRTTTGGNRTVLTNLNPPGTGQVQLGFRLGCAGGQITNLIDATPQCSGNVYTSNAWEAYTVHWNQGGPTLNQYSFGTNALTSIPAASGGGGAWRIGANKTGTTWFLNGDIPELVVYNTALSATDRQAIECYLYGKYGLAMDAGHACP